MTLRTATPEQVSAIAVYCGDCGSAVTADYIVSADETGAERLELAREHLRAEGWRCNDKGDLCPACPAPAPHGPRAARQVAEALAAAGHHSHLATDGQDDCLTGQCTRTGTDGRWEQ